MPRGKAAARRGADWRRVTLSAITAPGGIDPGELIAIDDTLDQLESHDSRAAQIAKLRIFAGLTISEVADVLGIPRRSVDRQWAFARAWLRTHLSADDPPPEPQA